MWLLSESPWQAVVATASACFECYWIETCSVACGWTWDVCRLEVHGRGGPACQRLHMRQGASVASALRLSLWPTCTCRLAGEPVAPSPEGGGWPAKQRAGTVLHHEDPLSSATVAQAWPPRAQSQPQHASRPCRLRCRRRSLLALATAPFSSPSLVARSFALLTLSPSDASATLRNTVFPAFSHVLSTSARSAATDTR